MTALHQLVNEHESIINRKDSLLADIKDIDGTIKKAEKTQQEICSDPKKLDFYFRAT